MLFMPSRNRLAENDINSSKHGSSRSNQKTTAAAAETQ
jgi:hypothetical protein